MSLVAFVLATWLPNLGLIWQIATSGSVPLADKVAILTALIGSIGTNFTIFSGFSVIAIAVLFGMNVAMVIYSFRIQQGGGAADRARGRCNQPGRARKRAFRDRMRGMRDACA